MSEVKGRTHPDMTPELAQSILPGGAVAVPLKLLLRLGDLLTPAVYADASGRYLIAIGDEINDAIDRALRAAQGGASTA